MKHWKKGIAVISAVLVFASGVSCSAFGSKSRRVADSYLNSMLRRDVDTCNSLCIDDNSYFESYMSWEYKNRAVDVVLNNTHYRFEDSLSGINSEGDYEYVYTLIMPDLNAALSMNPESFEEFSDYLGLCGRYDVTVSIVVDKVDGEFKVKNSYFIAENFWGSLYFPNYEFVLDGAAVITDREWTSSNEDGSFEDTSSINCHYNFSSQYLDSGMNLDLNYEYRRRGEVIYSSDVVMDGDGRGFSCPLGVNNFSIGIEFLPEFNYELIIYSSDSAFYVDNQQCTLNPSMFPEGSALDAIIWQHTDGNGRYFNTDTIDAKVWIDNMYYASGRPLNITYDIFQNGELVLRDEPAIVGEGVAVCVYESTSLLPTSNYSINVYNNGIFLGSSVTNVILNLNPENYTELSVATNVSDTNSDVRPRLQILTSSRNAIDVIDEYTDVAFNYDVISMEVFESRVNSILASGENAPDMIICNSSFANNMANNENTVALNDIGISYSELQYMYEYTFALSTDDNHVIKGVTWEINPGAVFYSRSVARNVLGVSEPGEVAPYFASWDAFLDTSRLVYENTNGTTRIMGDIRDIEEAYIMGRPDSWFDSNSNIVASDYVVDYFDLINTLLDEELTFDCGRWSSEWNSRISNRTTLAHMGTMRFGEVFLRSYNSGDWGVVNPPVDYFDGGHFIFVTSYSDMDNSAARFIRDVAINEENLEDMSRNQICVNNISIMLAAAEDDSYNLPWIGGQNPFKVFSQVAWNIDASVVTTNDEAINAVFAQVCEDFASRRISSASDAVELFEELAREVA
ncbi:MAG: extracellular solute-binding protein [Saccharofermentans sp.]|nr:extracellular solute-binding protein [Saccharofermentans sp.]